MEVHNTFAGVQGWVTRLWPRTMLLQHKEGDTCALQVVLLWSLLQAACVSFVAEWAI